MIDFRDALEVCGLGDLGFAGLPYTYDNKRAGRANVKVRLDRAVATNAWRDLFEYAKVDHLVAPSSDHLPILIRCSREEPMQAAGRRFRQYEVMWEREPSLPEVIMKTWTDLGSMLNLGDISSGLGNLMKKLQDWSRRKFGNVIKEINKSRSRLEELLSMNADRKEIREATDSLNELLYREEMMWMQRSRVAWLKEGDRNTKFFHRKAKWRARKNRIKKLLDATGIAHSDHGTMAAMVSDYFSALFIADETICPDPVIDLINTRVTDRMNVGLCADFSDKEIADALFQIGPLKAPGPDGFPARFFQRNWEVMRDQVIAGVKEFFRTGIMPEGVNDTAIVLIPKVDSPERVSEFRPISLCNVIYKVVAKCLGGLDLLGANDAKDGFRSPMGELDYVMRHLDEIHWEENGDFTPLKVCRRAPGVSHLLFADDTLLFFKAEEEQARNVKQVLHAYERATGQSINPAKCSALFGDACPSEEQQKVRAVLNIVTDLFEDKYLGLPTPEGRMSRGKFQNLQSRLLKRIIAWGDTLSLAGKETMIKAIAQAIPTYVMGVFKLLMSVCDDLNRMVRNFWWGASEGKRKTHWLAWPKILAHKTQGGLGFRDFRAFNQALLARQAWRLLINPHSLCAQVLKARYYPEGRLEDTVFSGNASPTWQAIQYGLELLKKGLVWRVGDGRNIRIWRDRWIPREPSRQLITQQGTCRLRRVAELLHEDGAWRVDLLHRYFHPTDMEVISSIRTSTRVTDDIIAWAPEKNGIFTVRSAYRFAMDERERPLATATSRAPDGHRAIWKIIWGCPAPPKVSLGEKELWHAMAMDWCIPKVEDIMNTGPEWLFTLLDPLDEATRMIVLMIMWRTWHVRNEITHDKKPPPAEAS
nr:uncharacterized protein LOC109764695 [Aegilops tauschii subsp. strangulata]